MGLYWQDKSKSNPGSFRPQESYRRGLVIKTSKIKFGSIIHLRLLFVKLFHICCRHYNTRTSILRLLTLTRTPHIRALAAAFINRLDSWIEITIVTDSASIIECGDSVVVSGSQGSSTTPARSNQSPLSWLNIEAGWPGPRRWNEALSSGLTGLMY